MSGRFIAFLVLVILLAVIPLLLQIGKFFWVVLMAA